MKKIKELLREVDGAEAEFARELKLSPQSVNTTLENSNNTLKTKKRYTEAFNRCFETDYTWIELFTESTIDND